MQWVAGGAKSQRMVAGLTLIVTYDPCTVILQTCNRCVVTTSPSWTGLHASAPRSGNTCSQISFNTVASNGFKT
jgi:hypothetical protein